MPVFEMSRSKIRPMPTIDFATLGMKERQDIQTLLRDHIQAISPDTLVISEEFGNWIGSARRIDLLGLHASGDLVVIELKRDDAGHMELQALRYAAMVSTMTEDQAIESYERHLYKLGLPTADAALKIKEHLSGSSKFGGSVRIVLVAAHFHKEITTTVLWMIDNGLNIACVRITPYQFTELPTDPMHQKWYLDVDRFIPLPGAEDYQVAVRNKVAREKIFDDEKALRNRIEYYLNCPEGSEVALNRRDLINKVVRLALFYGVPAADVQAAIPWKKDLFVSSEGTVSAQAVFDTRRQEIVDVDRRYFREEERLIHHGGMTYVMRKDWGYRTEQAVRNVIALIPEQHVVSFGPCRGAGEL